MIHDSQRFERKKLQNPYFRNGAGRISLPLSFRLQDQAESHYLARLPEMAAQRARHVTVLNGESCSNLRNSPHHLQHIQRRA